MLGRELSDREIARRWGMEWRSFAALKQGRRQVPRVQELEALATLLSIEPEFIFQVAGGAGAEEVAALLGRETRLRAALDHVTDAVFTLDLRGRVQDANRRFRELTGQAEVGHLFWDLLEPACTRRAVSAIASTKHSREVRDIEVTLAIGASPPRLLELDVTRIDDRTGEQIGVQVIARDVTDRRSLEREIETQRRTLTLIFENVPAACLLFERNGTIVAANHFFAQLFDRTAESAVGRSATEVFGISGDSPASRALLSGRVERDILCLTDRDGRARFVHRTASPIVTDGRVEQVVEILTDVTELVARGELRPSEHPGVQSRSALAGAERRGWPRTDAQFEAHLHYQGATLHAAVANLSPSGVFLTTEREIPPGSEVELAWPAPHDDSHQMRAVGVVVWSSRSDHGMGVRFLHVVKTSAARRYPPA